MGRLTSGVRRHRPAHRHGPAVGRRRHDRTGLSRPAAPRPAARPAPVPAGPRPALGPARPVPFPSRWQVRVPANRTSHHRDPGAERTRGLPPGMSEPMVDDHKWPEHFTLPRVRVRLRLGLPGRRRGGRALVPAALPGGSGRSRPTTPCGTASCAAGRARHLLGHRVHGPPRPGHGELEGPSRARARAGRLRLHAHRRRPRRARPALRDPVHRGRARPPRGGRHRLRRRHRPPVRTTSSSARSCGPPRPGPSAGSTSRWSTRAATTSATSQRVLRELATARRAADRPLGPPSSASRTSHGSFGLDAPRRYASPSPATSWLWPRWRPPRWTGWASHVGDTVASSIPQAVPMRVVGETFNPGVLPHPLRPGRPDDAGGAAWRFVL